LVFLFNKRGRYRNAIKMGRKIRYEGKFRSSLLQSKKRVIRISISKTIKIRPKIKNCREKGGRLIKTFSIPHSKGKALDKFLLFFSFRRIGKTKNKTLMIKVHLKVKICVIIN